MKVEVLRAELDEDRAWATVEARVTRPRLFGRPPVVTVEQFAVDQSEPASGRAHGGRWMRVGAREPVEPMLDLQLRAAVKAWMVCDWAEGALA